MRHAVLCFCLALCGASAGAVEDASEVGGPGPEPGTVVDFERLEALRLHLPPEFWAHRELFFYPGMQLTIGEPHVDYTPAAAYQAATERYAGAAQLGPDSSLEGYVAGQPFPMDEIDCLGDPDAGAKIMWNFDYQWEGDGLAAHYYYSYWDRGEQLPLYFEGTSKSIQLAHRVEPEALEKRSGDLFRADKRKLGFGIEVAAPFDARGIAVLTYRYKSSDAPPARAENDDTWVYVPTLRRVRRISSAQRTDAVSGTDFTFDDLRSFAGIVPQYAWQCLGEVDVVAPMNSRVRAYPYTKDHNFGPYGLSYADDVWELRRAVKVRMTPKNADHPYHHKDLYLDRQTLVALYSFAYDQKEDLWKIIWHNHRWSEDPQNEGDYYAGWEGVESPRDLRGVSDTIVNVQTGTGNRIEFWDNHGEPFARKGLARRYLSLRRLSQRN